MITLIDIKVEWYKGHRDEEFGSYLRSNYQQVYDINLNFIGYERI